MVVLKMISKIINYFPVKLMISGVIFSLVLLYNFDLIKSIQEQILLVLFQFFRVPAYYLDGALFLGSFYAPINLDLPAHTQILFLIFFPSLAVSARVSFDMRAKILLWGVICFFIFVGTQFLTIIALSLLGNTSEVSYVQTNFITIAMAGSLTIEAALFSTLTLPQRTKVKPVVKRSHMMEYVYFVILISMSYFIMYFMLNYLNITSDSPVAAYVAVNITSLMGLRFYITFFAYETRIPDWVKSVSNSKKSTPSSISFIIPAYNEERIIQRCIESIDEAAGQFQGRTEIVIVDDGSKDNTGKIIAETMAKLKHATAKAFTIPNSGKGFALALALKNVTGDVIFRLDADSVVERDAITPIMRHFINPYVGSVSGMIFPFEEKNIWQKTMVLVGCSFLFIKRGQELINSILCQPGTFSVFRKDALVKVGGWSDDQFGEDGEITIRLYRYGYKNEFEQHSVVRSEAPSSLKELRLQRLRWNLGFYHSRAKNMEIIRGLNGPAPFVYLFSMMAHGAGFMAGMYWPYLVALIITDSSSFSLSSLLSASGIPFKLGVAELTFFAMHSIVYTYFLAKFKRLDYMKYIPFMRVYNLIQTIFIKPEALEIILRWSSIWKEYNRKSYQALRKEMLR